jgi:aspartate aminotransferase
MTEATKPITISKLVSNIKPSATIAAANLARQMKAEGIKVFDFSLGEPDFPTPEHICKAAFKAMQEGHTHYTSANGIPELRKAIAKMYQKLYGLECTAEQIVVSNGAKHSLSNALNTICGPGDEVIIPTPYWVSYSDLVEMAGAKFVLVETSPANEFKMTPAQFRAAITPRTRLMMLNSPSNPSGTVYSKKEQEALADIALEAGICVLSDEIYERLVFGDARATCFATLRPGLADKTITISGVSKSYAMTGWRMGWAIAPLHVAKAMTSLQSQQTSNPSSISQYATLAALEGDQDCVEKMRREFEARRDLVCQRLSKMPGIVCPQPGGAFYAFFNVSSYFGKTLGGHKVTDSASFCKAALESAHICLVAGSAFGTEGYVRLSFATSRETLNGGLDRLEQWLASA